MSGKEKDATQMKPLKDRFLKNEKPENLYVTFALYFIMIFMSFLLIFVYSVAMCEVVGTSMNPTLLNGDNLLMQKNPTKFKVDDIITFRVKDPDTGEEKPLIKRVVGVAGDELVFIERSGTEYVDLYRKAAGTDTFYLVAEDYGDMLKSSIKVEKFKDKVSPDATPANMEKHKITVDDGYLLVLGDNRNNSQDSRHYGAIPTKDVRGKMFYRLSKDSLLERLLLLIYHDRSI